MLKMFLSTLAAIVLAGVIAGIILTDGTCLRANGRLNLPFQSAPPTPIPQTSSIPPAPSLPKQPISSELPSQNILPPAPVPPSICPDRRPVIQVIVPPPPPVPEAKQRPCPPTVKPMRCDWKWTGEGYTFTREKDNCTIILKEALVICKLGHQSRKPRKIDLVVFFGPEPPLISVKQYTDLSGQASVQMSLHLQEISQDFLLTKEWLGSLNHFWPALEYVQNILSDPRKEPASCQTGRVRHSRVFLAEHSPKVFCPDWSAFDLIKAE